MNRNLNDLYELCGGMDAKIDILLEAKKDHESRLRKLEKWRSKILGITAAATVGFTLLFQGVRAYFTKS